jgi:septal ring factor EnvC (AmiA/AmiB activator)
MKTHYILLLSVTLLIAGCDRPSTVSSQDSQKYHQQADAYEQGLKRAEENLAHQEKQTQKTDEQLARYDKIMDKQEEQARRMDAILDKLEKDQGIKK